MDLNALLADIAASPWVPLVVLLVCVLDGFFPPVPSETTVVAALAATVATGDPLQVSVIAVAAASGAVAGDSIAYGLGRRIGLARFAWMRRPAVRRVADWTRARVHRSPAVLILAGRYVPVGRVAVNATAGASRLAYRRFLPLSSVAAIAWALVCLAVATVSATWFGDPLWASLAAVAVMLVLGVVLDAIGRRRLSPAAPARRPAPPLTTGRAPAP